jgi:hypothetical protein
MASNTSASQTAIYEQVCIAYQLETGKKIKDVIQANPKTFDELLATSLKTTKVLSVFRLKHKDTAHDLQTSVGPIQRVCDVAGAFSSIAPFGKACCATLSHLLKVA